MSGYTILTPLTQAGQVVVVQTPSGGLVTTTWPGGTVPVVVNSK